MTANLKSLKINHNGFRILVCGNSEEDYPRDKTLISALQVYPGCRVVDCRFKHEWWERNFPNRSILGQFVSRAWKHLLRRRVRRLILTQSVDFVLIMKNNHPFAQWVRQFSRESSSPKIIYDLWVSRALAAERDGTAVVEASDREHSAIASSDLGIVLTEPYISYYADTLMCSPEKLAIIPMLVSDEWLTKPVTTKKNTGKFIIAYWGNFLKQHGLHILLEAANMLIQHDDIEFHLYGYTSDPETKKMLKNVGGNVRCFGRIPSRMDLIAAVDSCDVGVGHLLPIHDAHLVLPNKVHEGMARSKPMIHIAAPLLYSSYGRPESSDYCVCFFEGGEQTLANKILQLKYDPELAARIGHDARKRVEQYHSGEAVHRALKTMFDKLC